MRDGAVSFAGGRDLDGKVAEAIAILRRDGVVVLDHLVDPELVARCRDEVTARHPDIAKPDRERNFGPYEGRHSTPIPLEGALAEPALLLPGAVSRIARTMLEDTYKVDSVGILVSTPGAPDQIAHRDAWLYPKENLDRLLPPFALAFALPLVTMDELSGRTAFWRRSHRSIETSVDTPFDYAPTVEPGSAMLWDFRVFHAGMANRSSSPRPVVFTALSRQWWVEMHPPEATRYRKLQVPRSVHAAFPPRWKARFSRADLVEG
jgi:hypothetical protein